MDECQSSLQTCRHYDEEHEGCKVPCILPDLPHDIHHGFIVTRVDGELQETHITWITANGLRVAQSRTI